MKSFFRRIQNKVNQEFDQMIDTQNSSRQMILWKWVFIGLLAFLSVLFLFLQVSLAPSKEEATPPPLVEDESSLPIDEDIDDGPMFDFGTDESDGVFTPEAQAAIEIQIWQALMENEFQQAADLASNVVYNYYLSEDHPFLTWYQDIYLVSSVHYVPVSEQDAVLSTFKTPRFQAVFPTYTSVLTLAKMIDDPTSVLPIDVEDVQIVSEDVVSPTECQGVSDYVDSMLIHFKEIYKATIRFNSEEVTAYVGIFENGSLNLLGYYGDSTKFKTDDYWEGKRLDYALNPNF